MRTVIVTGLVALLCSSCTSVATDQTVTFVDYQEAVGELRRCLESDGVAVTTDLDPETLIYQIAMDGDPELTPCNAAFEPINAAWQLSVAAQRHALGLDEEKTERLRLCLDQHLVPWGEDMHSGELGVLLARNGIDRFSDCDPSGG